MAEALPVTLDVHKTLTAIILTLHTTKTPSSQVPVI